MLFLNCPVLAYMPRCSLYAACLCPLRLCVLRQACACSSDGSIACVVSSCLHAVLSALHQQLPTPLLEIVAEYARGHLLLLLFPLCVVVCSLHLPFYSLLYQMAIRLLV